MNHFYNDFAQISNSPESIYRVVVDGWTKQQAIDEMTKGGFGFHPIWSNLPGFIKNFNVQKVRVEMGLDQRQSNQ